MSHDRQEEGRNREDPQRTSDARATTFVDDRPAERRADREYLALSASDSILRCDRPGQALFGLGQLDPDENAGSLCRADSWDLGGPNAIALDHGFAPDRRRHQQLPHADGHFAERIGLRDVDEG